MRATHLVLHLHVFLRLFPLCPNPGLARTQAWRGPGHKTDTTLAMRCRKSYAGPVISPGRKGFDNNCQTERTRGAQRAGKEMPPRVIHLRRMGKDLTNSHQTKEIRTQEGNTTPRLPSTPDGRRCRFQTKNSAWS